MTSFNDFVISFFFFFLGDGIKAATADSDDDTPGAPVIEGNSAIITSLTLLL